MVFRFRLSCALSEPQSMSLFRGQQRGRERSAATPFDRDKYVQPSPPLSDDMYGEQVPPSVAALVSHLEECGMQTEDLFGGDPSVREINDVLDELRVSDGGADLYAVTQSNS